MSRWRRGSRLAVAAIGLALPAVAGAATTDSERWSGVADMVFQHPAADSLIDNRLVSAITQDRIGFIWVGTEYGLARWDGHGARFYRPDTAARPDGLASGYVQALHVDAQGRLWIGTGSGGLSRYDIGCDCFANYPAGPNGLSSVNVRAIADDGAGGVWVATDLGLDEVDPLRGVTRRMRHVDLDETSLPSDHVSSVLRDSRGRLWIGTLAGLVRRDGEASALVRVPLSPTDERPYITNLFEDSRGQIWVGTKNSGAYVIRAAAPELVPSSAKDGVQSIAEGRAGKIWIGTYSRGIIIVDDTTSAVRRIRHDPFVPSSLEDDTPWALHRDDAGSIWVGTSRGLSRYDPNQGAVRTLFGVTGRPTGISDPDVGAVLPLKDGGLWLGLGVNGIDFLDPFAGRVGGLRPVPEGRTGAPSPTEVLSFLPLASGDVYVFARNGLFRKGPHGTGLERLLSSGTRMQTGVLLPGSHQLWLGSTTDGLWTLDLAAHGPPAIERDPRSDKLTDPRVTAMAPGAGGVLWIGTMNGLNRFDPATGAVEQIATGGGGPTTIGAAWVSSLVTDRRGRLWVGTLGGGVSILEGRDAAGRPRFRHLGVADRLPDAAVDMLLEAPSGDVWASTDDGLAVIDPTSLAVRPLRQAEGVAITAYWAGSGAVTADGELAFGGIGGLTIVRPDRLIDHDRHAPVVVTDLHVGGKPAPSARFNGGGTAAPIEIEPRANSLAVEFAVLDYSAQQRSRYAYRLEGYDADWIETDWAHRVAAYTNLPPGRYVLHLRGSDRSGAWSTTTLALPIEVQRAWYQTIWFTVAEVLAALSAAVALLQARTSFLRQRQRQLERQVEERTAELRERERQLEQMAYFDLLTALPNRRMFTETFTRFCDLAQRQDTRFCLLLIDLDRFKQVNDTLGHDAGDALLVEAARRLQAAVRRSDYAFRLGGDEFAILLSGGPDFDLASVEVTCRRIVDGFAAPVPFKGVDMRTSPSIGIAGFPDDGTTQEDLYKAADLALYEAKQAGRNTWRWRTVPVR